MHANSAPVVSNQDGLHPHLAEKLALHAATRFLKPVAPWNREAFDAGMEAWRAAGSQPLILDAGCGVGLSTFHIAHRYPDHFVIGVDQSADRVGRNTAWTGPPPENCIRLRAELADFWGLLHEAEIRLARHYLLYPNPWPKQHHLGRRWHGHPIFPTIVALGGQFECRSNWGIYVNECATALSQLTGLKVAAERFSTTRPITPFEEKYVASGHVLWRCEAPLTRETRTGAGARSVIW